MNEKERTRADELAMQIALMELVRRVMADVYYHDDPAEFRRRVSHAEDTVVSGINGRTHFPQALPDVEEYIKESASAFVTNVMASILHPLNQKK